MPPKDNIPPMWYSPYFPPLKKHTHTQNLIKSLDLTATYRKYTARDGDTSMTPQGFTQQCTGNRKLQDRGHSFFNK